MPNANRFGLGCCCGGATTCPVQISFTQPCFGEATKKSHMVATLFDLTTGLQVGGSSDSNTFPSATYTGLISGRSYKFTVTFGANCNTTFVSPVDYPFTVDCSGAPLTIPIVPTPATYSEQIRISLFKGGVPTSGTLKYTDDGPPAATVNDHGGAITNVFFPFLSAVGPGASTTHLLHLEIFYNYTVGGPPAPHLSESRQDLTVTLDTCDSCTDSSGRIYVVNVP